jgi:hypothetical protein
VYVRNGRSVVLGLRQGAFMEVLARPGERCSSRWVTFAVGLLGVMLGFGAVAEAAELVLTWTAPVTNADGSPLKDLAGYRIYIAAAGTPPCPSSSYHAVPSSTGAPAANQQVSRTITGLNAGTIYTARLTAVDQNGNQSACSSAASAAARGSLSVSPTSTTAFGTITVGTTVDRTFTVKNTTSSTLSGSAAVGAPFSVVSGGSFSLAAGASQPVVVRFRPTSATSYVGNVTFTGGGDTIARTVSGSGTGSVSAPLASPPTLTVARSGCGSGTVTSAPTGISCGADCTQGYTAGTLVTLTAKPASGSRFVGWSWCSGTGTCSLTLKAATTITAMFAQVSTTLADLLMTSVSMPSTVSRTTGFPVAFNVVNQGSTSASAVKLRIYLSRDTKVSADDVVVSRLYWSCIAPKITIPNSITQTLPAGTSAGSYYLLLVVDASGTVAESNEGNNTVVRAIAVK